MNKQLQKFLNIAIPILLVAGTVSVYFFAKGYRYDFTNGEIEKTGVISIRTHPRRASIYIDDKLAGTSPRAFGGISEGTHTVRIEKDGYHSWTINVDVQIEQLVPLEVQLFLENPTTEALFASSPIESCQDFDAADSTPDSVVTESEILGLYADDANRTALFTHLTSTETCPTGSEAESTPTRIVEIWSYPITRQFWNLSPEAQIIAEFDETHLGEAFLTEQPDTDILIAPDGNNALISITTNSTEKFFIINTNSYNSDLSEIDTINNNTETPPIWAQDSQHLILVKNGELRSLNIDTAAVSVITQIPEEQISPFYWTSSISGELYFPTYTPDTLTIIQSNPDGASQRAIIEIPIDNNGDITEQNTPAADDPTLPENNPQPLTTNEISAEDIMNISDMQLTPLENRIIFFSDSSILTYSLESSTLETFPAENPTFISFSPNEQSLIYLDNNGADLREFWFDVEDTDPLHTFGPRTLHTFSNTDRYNSFTWHSNNATPVVFMNTQVLDGESSETSSGENGGENETESQIVALDTETKQTYQLTPSFFATDIAIDSSGKLGLARCSESQICLFHYEE